MYRCNSTLKVYKKYLYSLYGDRTIDRQEKKVEYKVEQEIEQYVKYSLVTIWISVVEDE